jgi:acetate kinase
MSEQDSRNILVLNCGSSSIKFQVIRMPSEELLAKGGISEIGGRASKFTLQIGDNKISDVAEILDHQYGVKKILDRLIQEDIPSITTMDDIHGVGHRTVHGAEFFFESVKIDNDVMHTLYDCVDFAPLHNPANIKGMEAARKVLPQGVHVAVFDTAFHSRMPAKAYRYALPKYFYDQHKIRRYGFHGTSHRFVSQEGARFLGKKPEDVNVITAHLGNGCSMTAIQGGVSVDTSMGFTPLEGLIMGTRVGDIDPAVLLMIMGREELSQAELNTLLNKHSGLLGISGVSSDMSQLLKAAAEGEKNAALAVDMFAYRVK